MGKTQVGGVIGRWIRSLNRGQELSHEAALRQAAARMRGRLLLHPVEGPWQELAYWDPLPTARELTDSVGYGRWEQRGRLNVPGPFYAGETDSGLNGPYYLPEHVLSDDRHCEFVHRQPVNPREVAALVEIAHDEPLGGYAWDGDLHWTPQAVRDWWARRDEVRAWIADELRLGDDSRNEPDALCQYAAHLDDGLEAYLRGYLFWLTEHREPRAGEALPEL
ncbi:MULTISPECIES: ferredoxin [Streptomycetaceae]|uniref:ferredoxin n=1 Tax=Streptomycetaceae TaxID=2062 RepID=UPI000B0E5025|nr:ferredoxin [Streptomyces sp. CB02056]